LCLCLRTSLLVLSCVLCSFNLDGCAQALDRQEMVARQRRAALALASITRQEAHAAVVPVRAHGLLALKVEGRRVAAAAVEDADGIVRRRAVAGCVLRHLVCAFVRLQAAVDVTATPLEARLAVIGSLVTTCTGLAGGRVAWQWRELAVGAQLTLGILGVRHTRFRLAVAGRAEREALAVCCGRGLRDDILPSATDGDGCACAVRRVRGRSCLVLLTHGALSQQRACAI